ncbi:MAG: hypothetical protein L0227_18420, partial [Chloroflexi bacterium]|nr:hypothetical protein [Chloroflexota bacterium]
MKLLGRIWSNLALPTLSIVLSVVFGSIFILVSDWLVQGELRPDLVVKAYSALVTGSLGSFNAIVNTLTQT